jgi:hypothetical protein
MVCLMLIQPAAHRTNRLTTVRALPIAVSDRVATMLAGPVSPGIGFRDTPLRQTGGLDRRLPGVGRGEVRDPW